VGRRRNGFTLIELLAVIAIIALLVTILMPTLSRAKELAREAVCLSNARSQGIAAYLYAEENDRRIPNFYGTGHGKNDPAGELGVIYNNSRRNCWADILIWADTISPGAFECPTESTPDPDPDSDRTPSSYGANVYMYLYMYGGKLGPGNPYEGLDGNLDAVVNPSEKFMFCESRNANPKVGLWGGREPATIRHQLAAVYTFADAHSNILSFRELYGTDFDPAESIMTNIINAAMLSGKWGGGTWWGTGAIYAECFPRWAPWY